MMSVISTVRMSQGLINVFFFFPLQRWCPIGWREWWTPTHHWLQPSNRWLPWRTVTAPIPSSRASPLLKCPVTTWIHMVSINPWVLSCLLPEAGACVWTTRFTECDHTTLLSSWDYASTPLYFEVFLPNEFSVFQNHTRPIHCSQSYPFGLFTRGLIGINGVVCYAVWHRLLDVW